jgi:hypothetical protein
VNTTIATTIRISPERMSNLIYGLQQEGSSKFRSPAVVILEALEIVEEIFIRKYPKIKELTDIEQASLLRSVNKLDNKDVSSVVTRLLETGVQEQAAMVNSLCQGLQKEESVLKKEADLKSIPKNFLS